MTCELAQKLLIQLPGNQVVEQRTLIRIMEEGLEVFTGSENESFSQLCL